MAEYRKKQTLDSMKCAKVEEAERSYLECTLGVSKLAIATFPIPLMSSGSVVVGTMCVQIIRQHY